MSLKKIREFLKLPIKVFAHRIGVSVEELKWKEKEEMHPDKSLMEKMSYVFELDLFELYLLSGFFPQDIINIMRENKELFIKTFSLCEKNLPLTASIRDTKPIFSTGLGKLYNADCLEWFPMISSGSVDCVFADPPFNLGKDYGEGVDDSQSKLDYLNWCYRWIDESIRVLKEGGALFIYNLPQWNIHLASYISKFLQMKHWICVDIKFSLPIAGRLYPSHYSLLYFVKGKNPLHFSPPRIPLQTCRHCGGEIKDYGGYKNKMNPEGVNLTDVWADIPPVRHKKYKNRSANELSIKLVDRVLDISTKEGFRVLDPFGGSGTTFAACELKGREWIGCEVGDCSPIIDRLKKPFIDVEQLSKYDALKNILFSEESLKLRDKFGHDTSKYKLSN